MMNDDAIKALLLEDLAEFQVSDDHRQQMWMEILAALERMLEPDNGGN